MIISTEIRKEFDKNPTPFMIKTLNKLEIKRNFLNLTKGFSEKTTITSQ